MNGCIVLILYLKIESMQLCITLIYFEMSN
jgi:hypothetical protein